MHRPKTAPSLGAVASGTRRGTWPAAASGGPRGAMAGPKEPSRAERGRREPSRAEEHRAEPSGAGQDRAEQGRGGTRPNRKRTNQNKQSQRRPWRRRLADASPAPAGSNSSSARTSGPRDPQLTFSRPVLVRVPAAPGGDSHRPTKAGHPDQPPNQIPAGAG